MFSIIVDRHTQIISPTPHLALEVYSTALLPHVSLDGLPGEDGFGESCLDGLHTTHVILTILTQNVTSGNTVRAKTMQNGLFETCVGVLINYLHSAVEIHGELQPFSNA